MHLYGTAQVGEKTEDKDNCNEQQDDNQVVHILPLVIIGKLGGHGNRYLPSGKCQWIEIGIKFTAYFLPAEERLNHHYHFVHGKGFQKTDKETAHDNDIHILRITADEAQQSLCYQIKQQYGL